MSETVGMAISEDNICKVGRNILVKMMNEVSKKMRKTMNMAIISEDNISKVGSSILMKMMSEECKKMIETVERPIISEDIKKSVASDIATKAYNAAMKEEWSSMIELCKKYRDEALKPMTVTGDTILHLAVYSEKETPLKELLSLVQEEFIGKPNTDENTPLHEAAAVGSLEATRALVNRLKPNGQYLQELLRKKNILGETPLFRAAALGRIEVVRYLASPGVLGEEAKSGHQRLRENGDSILHMAIYGQHFETAMWLLHYNMSLGEVKNNYQWSCLHVLANIPSAFKSGYHMGAFHKFVYWLIPNSHHEYDDTTNQQPNWKRNSHDMELGDLDRNDHHHSYFGREKNPALWKRKKHGWLFSWLTDIVNAKKKHELAKKLAKQLAPFDKSWTESRITFSDTGGPAEKLPEQEKEKSTIADLPETPLVTATKNGIIEIVEAILDEYPQAVEHISAKCENILHVAIKRNQIKIFKYVEKKLKFLMDRLIIQLDAKKNTMLHCVGDTENKLFERKLDTNPAVQLQEELKLFERIQRISPNHYELMKNNDDETPKTVFDNKHKELHEKATDWLKRTSESCSIIAVLIATTAFAATYTTPGGSNGNTGQPVLLNDPFFLVFAVMNALSLVMSLSSAVSFMSILTSPMRINDFIHSIPQKLSFAFVSLFLSLSFTMLTFGATVLLIIHRKQSWTMTLVYAVAFIPVTVFALFQFPMYKEIGKIVKMILPSEGFRKKYYSRFEYSNAYS